MYSVAHLNLVNKISYLRLVRKQFQFCFLLAVLIEQSLDVNLY